MINDPNATRLILAGARSVALATQVRLYTELIPDRAAATALATLADAVLRDWGITDAVEAPPTPASEPTLIWPPPDSTLPEVYRENYYHPRHPRTASAFDEGDTACVVGPDDRLVFTGRARAHADGGWLMRFSHDEHTFWLHHREVQPGAEIPVGQDDQG